MKFSLPDYRKTVGEDALHNAKNIHRFPVEDLKATSNIPYVPRSEQTSLYRFK
jgi:hypothetical protein